MRKPGLLASGFIASLTRATFIVGFFWVEREHHPRSSVELIGPLIASMAIGLIIGVLAGIPDHPIPSAVIGGMLSLLVSFVTVPFCVMCVFFGDQGFVGPVPAEPRGPFSLWLVIALITGSGALAGGIGGWLNRNAAAEFRLRRIERYREKYRGQSSEFLTTTLSLANIDTDATEAIEQILSDRAQPHL